ncbi:MAG TPA: threonine/serine exporter family protein [Patescibacteria group bacterium]|nr:threonine/serine exporter family protein [Patescibacteria group bacterium]
MKEFVLAFLGSYCPAILFNIERKNLIWAGLCGAIGWAAYRSIYAFTQSEIFGVFIAAIVISALSEIMAKVFKTPSTVFYIPSLFPIVPGISAYNTVLYIIDKKIAEAAYKGLETLGSAGAIAFGILLISTIFRYINTQNINSKGQ